MAPLIDDNNVLNITTLMTTQNNYDFILNASLDMVEAQQWVPTASAHLGQANMYMKNVDRCNDMNVSCMLTPGNSKFLLLHENHKSEEQIKAFFNEVYELYVKIVMNPFFDSTQKINIPEFDDKVKKIAAKCF